MVTAVIYTRISDDRTEEGAGVQRQLEDCRSLCQREGFDIVGEYVDNSISGWRKVDRPGWSAAAERIARGDVDVLVAYSSSRITRSARGLEDILDLLSDTDTRVATVASGQLDLTTADGIAMARIIGAMASAESHRTSERVKRAQQQAAEEGRPHGGRRRFGVEKDGTTIIPHEAALIKQAAEEVLDGKPLRQVAMAWNEMGSTTPTGRAWTGTLVRTLLKGPRLAGLRVRNGVVIGKGQWEPIIDEGTHHRLMALFNDPSRRGGPPVRSLLGGLALCGRCDGKLVQARRHRDHVALYSCPQCHRLTAVASRVDKVVSDKVLDRLHHSADALVADGDDSDDRADQITTTLGELDQRERALGESLATGDVTPLMLQGAVAAIAEERARLSAELRGLGSGPALLSPAEYMDLVWDWDNLDTDTQRAVIQAVVERVVVAPSAVRGGVFDESRVAVEFQ